MSALLMAREALLWAFWDRSIDHAGSYIRYFPVLGPYVERRPMHGRMIEHEGVRGTRREPIGQAFDRSLPERIVQVHCQIARPKPDPTSTKTSSRSGTGSAPISAAKSATGVGS